jgi:hypothetical protein
MKNILLCVMLMIGGWAMTAECAILQVVGGKLIGADDVQVGSNAYDVRFVDGTCADVYGLCDESKFTFLTLAQAVTASQALLNQVFIDVPGTGSFDTNPGLTAGCPGGVFAACNVFTPYATAINLPPGAIAVTAQNSFQEVSDFVLQGQGGATIPYTLTTGPDPNGFDNGGSTDVWALWTRATVVRAVPEPDISLIIGIGLLAIGAVRQRYSRRIGDKHRGVIG